MMPVLMAMLMKTSSTTMKMCSEMQRMEFAGLVLVRCLVSQDRQITAVDTSCERLSLILLKRSVLVMGITKERMPKMNGPDAATTTTAREMWSRMLGGLFPARCFDSRDRQIRY